MLRFKIHQGITRDLEMDFNAVSLQWFSWRDEPKYQFIQRIKYRSDEISHTKQEKNVGNFSSPMLSHTLIKHKK